MGQRGSLYNASFQLPSRKKAAGGRIASAYIYAEAVHSLQLLQCDLSVRERPTRLPLVLYIYSVFMYRTSRLYVCIWESKPFGPLFTGCVVSFAAMGHAGESLQRATPFHRPQQLYDTYCIVYTLKHTAVWGLEEERKKRLYTAALRVEKGEINGYSTRRAVRIQNGRVSSSLILPFSTCVYSST